MINEGLILPPEANLFNDITMEDEEELRKIELLDRKKAEIYRK